MTKSKLVLISERARMEPECRFTCLAHLLDAEFLKSCYCELGRDRASGIDGVSWKEYGERLERNLEELVMRMKARQYRPQPSLRVYIPKDGRSMRPLGLPALEDKIVQKGMAKILGAIYEQDFHDCSYGFRPGRGCHQALKEVGTMFKTKRLNHVIEADIRGFFDHVSHEWMMRLLEKRISDPSFLLLVRRFLKAGYVEEGMFVETPEGTPQGGNLSPVLSNIFLHYVLDEWFEKTVKTQMRGCPSNGNKVAEYEYDAFGRTIVKAGVKADDMAFRFSTKHTDSETGLTYYGYRYYNADTGRWLNRDRIEEGGGNNLYVFASNNPIIQFFLTVKNIRKISQGNNAPTLFEEFGGGSCTCNINPLRSPAVIITNNDKTCTSGCTQLHEEVHEMDIQACCEKARSAMYWPWIFDTDKYLKLMDKYYDYEKAIAPWSELRAYKMSKGCLEKLKAQKKSEGKDCECLKEIDDRLNQVNDYLNNNKTSESKPSCPF